MGQQLSTGGAEGQQHGERCSISAVNGANVETSISATAWRRAQMQNNGELQLENSRSSGGGDAGAKSGSGVSSGGPGKRLSIRDGKDASKYPSSRNNYSSPGGGGAGGSSENSCDGAIEIGSGRNSSNNSDSDVGRMSVRAAIDSFIENCLSARTDAPTGPQVNLSSITGIVNGNCDKNYSSNNDVKSVKSSNTGSINSPSNKNSEDSKDDGKKKSESGDGCKNENERKSTDSDKKESGDSGNKDIVSSKAGDSDKDSEKKSNGEDKSDKNENGDDENSDRDASREGDNDESVLVIDCDNGDSENRNRKDNGEKDSNSSQKEDSNQSSADGINDSTETKKASTKQPPLPTDSPHVIDVDSEEFPSPPGVLFPNRKKFGPGSKSNSPVTVSNKGKPSKNDTNGAPGENNFQRQLEKKTFSDFLQDRLMAQIDADRLQTKGNNVLTWQVSDPNTSSSSNPPTLSVPGRGSSLSTSTTGPVRLQTLIDKVLDQSLNKDTRPLPLNTKHSPSSVLPNAIGAAVSSSSTYSSSYSNESEGSSSSRVEISTMCFKDHIEKVLEQNFRSYEEEENDKLNIFNDPGLSTKNFSAGIKSSSADVKSPDVEILKDHSSASDMDSQRSRKKNEGTGNGKYGPDGTISVQDIVDRVISQTEVISKLLTPGQEQARAGGGYATSSSAAAAAASPQDNANRSGSMTSHPGPPGMNLSNNMSQKSQGKPSGNPDGPHPGNGPSSGSNPSRPGPTGRKRGRPRLGSPNRSSSKASDRNNSESRSHLQQQRAGYPPQNSSSSAAQGRGRLGQSGGPPPLDYVSPQRLSGMPPLVGPQGGGPPTQMSYPHHPHHPPQSSHHHPQQPPHSPYYNTAQPPTSSSASNAPRSSPGSSSAPYPPSHHRNYHGGLPSPHHAGYHGHPPPPHPSSHPHSHHRPGGSPPPPSSLHKRHPDHNSESGGGGGKPLPLLVPADPNSGPHHHRYAHPHTPTPSCSCEVCVETFSSRNRSPHHHHHHPQHPHHRSGSNAPPQHSPSSSSSSSSSSYPPPQQSHQSSSSSKPYGQQRRDDYHPHSSPHHPHHYHPYQQQQQQQQHARRSSNSSDASKEALKPVVPANSNGKQFPPQAIIPSFVATQQRTHQTSLSPGATGAPYSDHPDEERMRRRSSSFSDSSRSPYLQSPHYPPPPHSNQRNPSNHSDDYRQDMDRPVDLRPMDLHKPGSRGSQYTPPTAAGSASPAMEDDQPLDLSVKPGCAPSKKTVAPDNMPYGDNKMAHGEMPSRDRHGSYPIQNLEDSMERNLPYQQQQQPPYQNYYHQSSSSSSSKLSPALPPQHTDGPAPPQPPHPHTQQRTSSNSDAKYYPPQPPPGHSSASPSSPYPHSKHLESPTGQTPRTHSNPHPQQAYHHPYHGPQGGSTNSAPPPNSSSPANASSSSSNYLSIPPHLRRNSSSGGDSSHDSSRPYYHHQRGSPYSDQKHDDPSMPRLYQPPRNPNQTADDHQPQSSPYQPSDNRSEPPSHHQRPPPPLMKPANQQQPPQQQHHQQQQQQPGVPTSPSNTNNNNNGSGNNAIDDPDNLKYISRHEPIQNIIGNHPQNDILYLICKLCRQTYGSPYGFRKHFRNQHGFEPKVEHTIVQTISATKTAMGHSNIPEGASGFDDSKIQNADEAGGNTTPYPLDRPIKMEAPDAYGGDDLNPSQMAAYHRAQEHAKIIFKQDSGEVDGSGGGNLENAKVLECPECGQTFQLNDFGSYKRHCRQHSMVQTAGPFSCHDCHRSFAEPGQLEQHLNTHNTFTPSVCGICRTFFSSPHYLAEHLQAAHGHVLPSEMAKNSGNKSSSESLSPNDNFTNQEKPSPDMPQVFQPLDLQSRIERALQLENELENRSASKSPALESKSPSNSSTAQKRSSPSLSSLPPTKRHRMSASSSPGSSHSPPTASMLTVHTPKQLEVQKRQADTIVSSASPDSSFDDQSKGTVTSAASSSSTSDTVTGKDSSSHRKYKSSGSSPIPSAKSPRDSDFSDSGRRSGDGHKSHTGKGSGAGSESERCASVDSNNSDSNQSASVASSPGLTDDSQHYYKHKKYSRHLKRRLSNENSNASGNNSSGGANGGGVGGADPSASPSAGSDSKMAKMDDNNSNSGSEFSVDNSTSNSKDSNSNSKQRTTPTSTSSSTSSSFSSSSSTSSSSAISSSPASTNASAVTSSVNTSVRKEDCQSSSTTSSSTSRSNKSSRRSASPNTREDKDNNNKASYDKQPGNEKSEKHKSKVTNESKKKNETKAYK